MTYPPKISRLALIATAVILSSAVSFAATPALTTAPPYSGMPIGQFTKQLASFNKADIDALLNAKSVQIVKFNDAWKSTASTGANAMSQTSDQQLANNALKSDAGQIDMLRAALKNNFQAVKLLDSLKIAPSKVDAVVPAQNGMVSIYLS